MSRLRYAFPTASDVARLTPEKYRAIEFSHQKIRALLESRPMDYAGVRRAVTRWWAYARLVYFRLLLDRLTQAVILESSATR